MLNCLFWKVSLRLGSQTVCNPFFLFLLFLDSGKDLKLWSLKIKNRKKTRNLKRQEGLLETLEMRLEGLQETTNWSHLQETRRSPHLQETTNRLCGGGEGNGG